MRRAAVAAAALAASLLVPGASPGAAQQTAKLTVTKSAPGIVDAHDKFSYTVTVKNDGDVNLFAVTMQDRLPDEVAFKSLTVSRPDFTCSVDGKLVSCSMRLMRGEVPGQQKADVASVTINVQDSVEGPATIRNTANASSTRPALKSSDTATTTVAAADIAVTKTGPATAFVGDPVTYTLTVTNKGRDRATGVALTDTLSPLLSGVSATGCAVGATVSCALGTVNAGETRTVQVTGTANAVGTATDTASVSTTSTDTDHTNDSSTASTALSLKPVDLAIAMTVTPASATLGDTVTYRIVVTNKGPGTGTSTVTDKLPASMHFLSVSAPCTHAGALVTCPLGVLAVGASAAPILVRAKAIGAGSVVNTATVKGATSDPVSTNNDAKVTARVKKPKTTTTTHTTTTHTTTTSTTPTTTGTTTTTPTTTGTTTTAKPKHKKKKKHKPESSPPKLTLSPPVGPLGTVVHVTGSGFPPNAEVALRWSKGIGSATARTGEKGRFATTMLIFQTDVLGPRRLFAAPGAGSPAYDVVAARFLVALRALQPADFE